MISNALNDNLSDIPRYNIDQNKLFNGHDLIFVRDDK